MWLLRSAHKHIGQDTLSEYLDGRLRDRPLERVERQLAECDACRQDLAELQAVVAMMRQLPMETPRRSFVMSAPPPEPARARPALPLRAPNWVYAGAASVAALALAITVSVDATGGLSSDPLRRDVEITAAAPAAAAAESASRPGDASVPIESETAPMSLAAAAPAEAGAEPSVQDEPAGGGAAASGADTGTQSTPAPAIAAARAPEDGASTFSEAAAAPQAASVPETSGADSESSAATESTAKALSIEEPAKPELEEAAEPVSIYVSSGSDTSVWWRVLEAAAGVLAAVFLAGLFLRRRAGRRDLV